LTQCGVVIQVGNSINQTWCTVETYPRIDVELSFQFFEWGAIGQEETRANVAIQIDWSRKLTSRTKQNLVIDQGVPGSQEGAISNKIRGDRMGYKEE